MATKLRKNLLFRRKWGSRTPVHLLPKRYPRRLSPMQVRVAAAPVRVVIRRES